MTHATVNMNKKQGHLSEKVHARIHDSYLNNKIITLDPQFWIRNLITTIGKSRAKYRNKFLILFLFLDFFKKFI